MAIKTTAEERLLIKLIEKMPVTAEEKSGWIESIQTTGLTIELSDTIRQKLTNPAEGESPAGAAVRARNLTELTRIVNRWRLNQQSKNFARR